MKCPHCNSENTQTYEAIFNKEYRTYNSKHNNSYGTIYTKGQSISPLGQKVFPPVKKKIKIFSILLNIVISITFMIMFHVDFSVFLSVLKKQEYSSNQLVTVIHAIFIYTYTILSIKRFIYNKSTYPNLYKNWQSHWYCHKCSQGFSNIK